MWVYKTQGVKKELKCTKQFLKVFKNIEGSSADKSDNFGSYCSTSSIS
jgi:hypothetical protein